MSYFVNTWRHLNISCVVLIASGQSIRRFEDDNLCYKCLFDSVVSVSSYSASKMESTKQEIRHILRFYYPRGKNATKAAENFAKFMGPIL